MACPKGVIGTLVARRKGREPASVLDGRQACASSREYLVRIGLVADIPHEPIVRGLIDVMQRHAEFDHTQTRGKMTAFLTDGLDEVAAQLLGYRYEFRLG